MAVGTVHVRGWRETYNGFNKLSGSVVAEMVAAPSLVAESVAESARRHLSRYPGASVSTIGPRVSARGIYVTQRKRKVTGQRPDFGSLQMRKALIPALHEHSEEIVRSMEVTLDQMTREEGF